MVGMPAEALVGTHPARERAARRGRRAARAGAARRARHGRGAPPRARDAHERRPALAVPAPGPRRRGRGPPAGERHHGAQARRAAAHRGPRGVPGAGRGLARPRRARRRRRRIGFVNSAFEQRGRAARRRPSWGARIAETDLPGERGPSAGQDGVRAVFARGERLAVDFRFPAEGGARWFSARLLPEPGPSGAVEHVISAFTDITDRVNQEAEQAALRRVATVVAREGDLEEIGRVVAEEATLLLGATGSAVYRFESQDTADLRRRPPAGRGRRGGLPHHVDRRHHRDRPHGEDRRGRARRRLRATLPRDPSVLQVLEAGLRSGIAAPLAAGGRVWGAPHGRLRRAARVRPGRGAPPGGLRRARGHRRRQRRGPRRARAPGRDRPAHRASPTGAPSRSGSTARSSGPAATATC